jgi:D-alanyl-D-alanine carboxypeptidase
VLQLLQHSSGMPDYFDDDYQEAAVKDRRMLVDVERALAGVLNEEPNAKPGAAYEYSNTNYALLGLILERADHADLGAVLARRVFRPAGMAASSVGADPGQPDVASAHGSPGPPSDNDNLIAYASHLGDGPVTTTAPDLGRFLSALLREKTLLKPATLQRMLTRSRRERGYGLGIEISDGDWGPCYGHNGSVTGINAEAWFYAGRKTSIVFLTNGEYRTDSGIVDRVADMVFKAAR